MNVSMVCSGYDFELTGVSYIGKPKSNTVIYVYKKLEKLLTNLEKVHNCLVFAENTIDVPVILKKNNCILSVENPGYEYSEFIKQFEGDKKDGYTYCADHYYIGYNVLIGENAYIEPGCLIGHNVIIGKNARIMTGVKIKHAVIGDNFVANENATIGTDSFTMVEDKLGNNFRIPSMGKVFIGNNVEIGAGDNIVRGSTSDTIIEDNVKIDALTYVAHDVYIEKNARITAGVIIAGFVHIGKKAFIGINSGIRNRISLGENSYIGMGANVIKDVETNKVVVGNPATVMKETV